MKKVPGKWSALTRTILENLFLEEKIATAGIQLCGTNVRVKFQAMLADEEALAAIWNLTGASGVSPCGVMCSVTNKPVSTDVARGIESVQELDPEIPDISCSDESKLGLRTDDDVWGLCDALELASPTERANLAQHCGIKHGPATLLYSMPLRAFVSPTESNRFDPMHVLASNGILGQEMFLFLEGCKAKAGAYFAEVRAFHCEEGWHPKTGVFSEVRERSATTHIKAGASELLGAYPLLRRFALATHGADAPELYVKSLLLFCEIMDVFRLMIAGGGVKDAEPLPSLVSRYLEMFMLSHGLQAMRWKHHALMHLCRQILLDGRALSCWVTERKNIDAKMSMAHNKCKGNIERTALSRMLNSQVRKLQKAGWISQLSEPIQQCPDLAATFGTTNVEISCGMKWRGMSITCGDVLFVNADRSVLVVVVGCLAINNQSSWGILVNGCRAVTRTSFESAWAVATKVSYHMFANGDRLLTPAFHRFPTPQRLEVLH